MNAPVLDVPAEHRNQVAAARLLKAAKTFGDARLAVDRHDGERTSPGFTAKVQVWRRAAIELQSAARAYATTERSRA